MAHYEDFFSFQWYYSQLLSFNVLQLLESLSLGSTCQLLMPRISIASLNIILLSMDYFSFGVWQIGLSLPACKPLSSVILCKCLAHWRHWIVQTVQYPGHYHTIASISGCIVFTCHQFLLLGHIFFVILSFQILLAFL